MFFPTLKRKKFPLRLYLILVWPFGTVAFKTPVSCQVFPFCNVRQGDLDLTRLGKGKKRTFEKRIE